MLRLAAAPLGASPARRWWTGQGGVQLEGRGRAIAGLEFDSAVDDDDDLARVRDAGSERRLRFRGAGRVVEVVLVDNTRRLAGQIDPPLAGSVVLRHSDGATLTAPVNHRGQFFFDSLRRGAFSLRQRARRPRSRRLRDRMGDDLTGDERRAGRGGGQAAVEGGHPGSTPAAPSIGPQGVDALAAEALGLAEPDPRRALALAEAVDRWPEPGEVSLLTRGLAAWAAGRASRHLGRHRRSDRPSSRR